MPLVGLTASSGTFSSCHSRKWRVHGFSLFRIERSSELFWQLMGPVRGWAYDSQRRLASRTIRECLHLARSPQGNCW